MSKRLALGVVALALVGTGPASADSEINIGSVWDHPYVKELKESMHPCGGAIDYACIDGSGAFCTVWLGRCTVGE